MVKLASVSTWCGVEIFSVNPTNAAQQQRNLEQPRVTLSHVGIAGKKNIIFCLLPLQIYCDKNSVETLKSLILNLEDS